MKIRILKIGKVAYPEIRDLAEHYLDRVKPLARPHTFDEVDLKDDAHCERHLQTFTDADKLIVLDEYGKEWDSLQFAGEVQKLLESPATKSLNFVVGGPMGLPVAIKDKATIKLALSKATFTSDLAWLILMEQIYRAFNIIRGTNYHHGKRD